MNIFIPFIKYYQLQLCESIKDQLKYRKLIISEESKQKYHSTSTVADFKAKGIIYGVNNGILKPDTVNVDIGAGKFNTVTKFLAKHNVTNLKYDPFLISSSENKQTVLEVKKNPTDSSTVNNVLNVIAEDEIVLNTINQAARAIKESGISIFTIYEGNKSGDGEESGSDGFQRNMKTSDYVPMIETYFSNVDTSGNVIIAYGQKDIEKSFWPLDADLDYGISI